MQRDKCSNIYTLYIHDDKIGGYPVNGGQVIWSCMLIAHLKNKQHGSIQDHLISTHTIKPFPKCSWPATPKY